MLTYLGLDTQWFSVLPRLFWGRKHTQEPTQLWTYMCGLVKTCILCIVCVSHMGVEKWLDSAPSTALIVNQSCDREQQEVNVFHESCLPCRTWKRVCSLLHKGTPDIKLGLNSLLLPSSDRQSGTRNEFTFFCYSLQQNDSVDILFLTFLLTDPEVFLMLLHNSVWCCIATVQVSLYVTGEGDFSRGRTGGCDCWCGCLSSGWVNQLGNFWWGRLQGCGPLSDGLTYSRMSDWWLMEGWMKEGRMRWS